MTSTSPPPVCAEYAPGVSRLIGNSSLNKNEQEDLFKELEAALRNELEHSWLKREEGVSFNPLPARLIEILLRECGETDLSILKAALHYDPEGFNLKEDSSPATLERLAYLLDVARHLHRSNFSKEGRLEIWKNLELASNRIPQEIQSSRLVTLFLSAVERLGRMKN